MTILLSFLTFGPYHLARFNASRDLGVECGLEIKGLAMASTHSDYLWEKDSAEGILCAAGEGSLESVRPADWMRRLEPILEATKPNVCAIAGYSHPAMLSLVSLCARRSIPWILMSDSREVDLPRTRWREWSKRRIVRLASSGFAAGRVHIQYLEKLGLEPQRCATGYDVVDNPYFSASAAKWRIETSSLESGEAFEPFLLASNRFIPKKNLFRLLEAFSIYVGKARSGKVNAETLWSLCLLGDGGLREALLTHADALGLEVVESAPWETGSRPSNGSGRLYLPGFRQIDELPRFYAAARAFVHASTTEQWGLVVNEAMASGLPVVVSRRCGCTSELVREGENGFAFDPYRVEELAALMVRLAEMDVADLGRMGEASRRIIADWGLERFSSGLRESAEMALQVGPKRPRFLERILLHLLARRNPNRSDLRTQ